VEEIFYFVTPLAVAAIWAMGASRRAAILMGATAIILVSTGSRVYAAGWMDMSFTDIRAIVVFRLDAIMVGVLLAGITSAGPVVASRARAIAVASLPLLLIAASLSALPDAVLNGSLGIKLGLFPLTSIGCAALILAGYPMQAMPRHVDAVTSRIARWSYSAYLVNVPWLAALHAFMPVPASIVGCIGMWLGYIAGTLFLSSFVYRAFEAPLLGWRDRLTHSHHSVLVHDDQQGT